MAWDQDDCRRGEPVPLDGETGTGRFGKGRAGRENQPVAGEWESLLQSLSNQMNEQGRFTKMRVDMLVLQTQ